MRETLLPFAAGWWNWIAPLAIQAGLLALAVGLVDRLLPRRTWPQLRIVLWQLVLLKLILAPSLGLPASLGERFPSPFRNDWIAATESGLRFALPWQGEPAAQKSANSAPLAVDSPTDKSLHIVPETTLGMGDWALALPLIWFAGVVVFGGAGLLRYSRMRMWLRRHSSTDLPDWLTRESQQASELLGLGSVPRVVASVGAGGPFVVGLWNPTVFVPRDLERDDAPHVLLHEFSHIRRGDLWLAAAETVIQVLYWFHPLVWWSRRRIGALREQCCDRTVVRALAGQVQPYRQTLARFALRQPQGPLPGLGFLRPRSLLLYRLDQLRFATSDRPLLRRVLTFTVLIIGLCLAVPVAHSAEQASQSVAEWIERPPGCLPLRYLVMQRLAAEQASEKTAAEAALEAAEKAAR